MLNENGNSNKETTVLNPLKDLKLLKDSLKNKILTPQQERKIHGELLKLGENLFSKEDLKKLTYLISSFSKLSETTLGNIQDLLKKTLMKQ